MEAVEFTQEFDAKIGRNGEILEERLHFGGEGWDVLGLPFASQLIDLLVECERGQVHLESILWRRIAGHAAAFRGANRVPHNLAILACVGDGVNLRDVEHGYNVDESSRNSLIDLLQDAVQSVVKVVWLRIRIVMARPADVVRANEDGKHLPIGFHVNRGIISGRQLFDDIIDLSGNIFDDGSRLGAIEVSHFWIPRLKGMVSPIDVVEGKSHTDGSSNDIIGISL